MKEEKMITLTEVSPNGDKHSSISIKQSDLKVGVIALGELRRNNMGIVTVGQIRKLEDYIKKTGQKKFTKRELKAIIGETQDAE